MTTSTISSGESDERAVSVTEWIRNNYQDHTTVDSLCDALDRTLAALATQPAESKACASVGVEPITVEAVATVVRGDDGELRLSWLIEGSLSAMVEGEVLMISGGANLTDDEGRGEVYLAPFTPPAVEESPNEARRQALAFGEYLKDCDKHAIQTDTAGAFLWAWRAALASPAPSVGEPVAQWQTSASGEGGWMNIDADEVEFCRDKRGYKVRALVLATPPAAPAATEAPSEQEEKLWGEFLADLEQIRPIGKRHAGMLKAVKKYRLLGEG